MCAPKQWKSLKQSEMTSDGYPVYGANGVIGYYSEYNHEEETILAGCRGTCGEVNLCAPYSYVTSNAMCLDRLSDRVDRDYLICFLKAYNFGRVIGGTSQPQITKAGISSIEVPLFSLEKQIVIRLRLKSILDELVSCKALLAKLDTLVKSRFVEIFGSYSNEFETTLQDVSEFVTVGIANAATHAYVDSGVVMLRNLNVRENQLEDSDLVYIDPEFAAKYKKKRLKAGDILVTRTGYPGIACVVPKKYEGCQTFTTLIVRLRDDSPVTAEYVSQLINSPIGKEFVGRFKAGSSQQNFGATALKMMPIGIPPLALQQEFATFVAEVDKSRFNLLKAYGSIIALFRVLFP